MAGESAIEKDVCDWARDHGFLVRKLKWLDRTGAPDRFMKHPAMPYPIFVEFKDKGKKRKPDQVREGNRLCGSGLRVVTIDDVEKGIKLLEEAARPWIDYKRLC